MRKSLEEQHRLLKELAGELEVEQLRNPCGKRAARLKQLHENLLKSCISNS